ncbi:UDP-glucuronosyltransferase 1-3 [Orchesella cincta]|uniref:UDP-glucuronosyltransferase n=1 Tax=Orchesella cincta TaxID=48709 RepID=A0A1D2NF64_ORCCI|nr:UDP-glucuronosyltransferase 1-3 [Orchesella cincta]
MKALIFTLLCVTFLSVIQRAYSANFLIYNAVGTHSTRISMTPYMEALANKGHNITFLSAFENNDPVKHPQKECSKMWYELKNLGLAACTMLYSRSAYFVTDEIFQAFTRWTAITKTGLELDEFASFSEIEKNASLILLTTHFSMDYPRSFPPNVIPIGGTVVSKKTKPLPKDMEKFINEGKEGFIFISFGSVAEFVNFDEEVQREFILALKSFPKLRFIWKSTFDINATLPSNVLVTKWAPQQTLLAHPKIKAFVTHSGMGSTTEAIHFAVPLICVPILAEQDMNAEVIALRGAGIKLEIIGLRQHEMEHALTEILHNEKYRNGMKKLSEIFKDRQIPPLETAVWWTEYILRHEDTNSFLRSPSVEQTWWAKRNVDVWVVLHLAY